ncbi:MAG: tetratricopeptide repeat protein [Betaproteobacteria bacterium]|nr:tetratricopeptide repeat protein [Betaproteobacteria bacterium]
MLGSVIRRFLRRNRIPAAAPAASLKEAIRLQQAAQHAEAEQLARFALDAHPDDPEALNVLAAALCAQGRPREGITCLRRITEIDPADAHARVNLAVVLGATGDAEGAIEHFRRALALRPDLVECAEQLAGLLKALGRYDDAEACARDVIAVGRDSAALRHVLAGTLFEQGRVDEAITEVRSALALNPALPAAHSDLVRMLNYSQVPDPDAIYGEHVAWAERHAQPLERTAAPHANIPHPTRRLRVGFVSPYFRKHAMNFFFESTAEFLDRDRFEMVLYADVAQPDEYSERLKHYGAKWRSTVGTSDAELANMVREDAVDILVDLSGHTPGNRLLAFARKPAPVQVTWNGYPNTTGMKSMDVRVTDAYCDPPGTTAHLHSERLAYLPRIYMTWRPPPDAPLITPLPALTSGQVTFGSFNSCFKVTPAVVATWARILAAVPSSRLMLVTVGAGTAERRIRELFATHGIGGDRLEILPRLTHEEFLAAHARSDIALDTFPYHGTTTTCFSLWMGLPVVTLAGATPVSRVGVTILNNVGLPELIARGTDEYVTRASRLAADLPGLAALREGMRERMVASPLTNGRAGALALQSAFRGLWAAWCSRQPWPGTEKFWPATSPRNAVVASEYGPVVVSRRDTMIGASIAKDGWWEKDEIELLRWFISACYGTESTVEIIDVGAYTGVYAIALARFPFSGVTVHAFEPQREIYEMLTETVAANELENVHCHHKAVSSESAAILRFPAVDYDNPANFGSVEIEPVTRPDFDGRRHTEQIEEVETVRIDDLALNKLRLIKIDAEGMEHKVLAGAADTLRRCRPLIFVEYEKTDFDALKALLLAAGYRAFYAQRPNILCLPVEFDHIRIEGAKAVEL